MKNFKLNPLFSVASLPKSTLLAALVAASISTSLQAAPTTTTPADNLGSQKNGAFVSYSTPLKGGANANNFVSGQPNSKLSFANQGGTHIIVVDLGKPSKLSTAQLKFSNPAKLQVFVLKKKPDGNAWGQAIAGLTPDGVINASGVPTPLDGAEGQFLVLVCPNNPGSFSDFFVTGYHIGGPNDPQIGFNNNHGGGQGGPLSEVPLPSSAYKNHGQPPPVPHESD